MRNGRKLHVASRCCVIGCQRQLYVDNAVAAIIPLFRHATIRRCVFVPRFTEDHGKFRISRNLVSRAQVSSSRLDLVKFVAFRDCRKRREFSTSVRRFSYSVISERMACIERPCRVSCSRCSMLNTRIRTHFAVSR